MYPRKSKKSGQVKQYKKGRICKQAGCKQRLSIYNREEYCHSHWAALFPVISSLQ